MFAFLVLTDFSAPSDSAARLAMELAARWPAELVFGHALNLPVDWERLPEARQLEMADLKEQVDEARQKLEGWAAEARKAGLTASTELRFNAALTELYESRAQPFDLIIMGTGGKRRFRQLFSGSQAQRMLRQAFPPVLIVKAREEVPRLKRLLFASEMEAESAGALQQLVRFARRAGVQQLGITRINTPYNFRSTPELEAAFRAYTEGLDVENLQWLPHCAYQVEEGIQQIAADWQADLVAVSTHARTDLSDLLLDSIPVNLAQRLPVPLLSYRMG